jgi:hypothetical protein
MKKASIYLIRVYVASFATLFLAACNKEQQMSSILAIDSLQPIEFYGRVIDQHGNPVIGAKVRGAAEIVQRWMDQKWDEHFTETDGNGYFHFSGLHGQSLVVSPSKEGYEYKSNNVVFSYSGLTLKKERHEPNPKKPVVFTMWKLKGAERLIEINIHDYIPCDGTAMNYDMQHSKKTAGDGNLIVKLIRNPLTGIRGKHFDWKITLEIPSGGLVELNDLYPNEAPVQGYGQTAVIDMPSNAPNWTPAILRSYYFKSGEYYGRILLNSTVDFDPPPTVLRIKGYINQTAGSRNLEYDPNKQALLP